ncbi:shikimate kinase [Pseudoneobacillus sp. C159]
MKSIYLIGFMGAGKTTVGKELADCLRRPVFDTDEEIVRSTNRTISDIFATEGEAFFRSLEITCLRNLPVENSIITTGGGIILSKENRSWMKEKGIIVFLNATPEEILQRLSQDDTRPLLKEDKVKQVTERLKARLPLYMTTADMVIDTNHKSIKTITKEIVEELIMV